MTPPPKTTLVLVFSFSDAATKRTDPNSGKICRSKTDYDDDDDLE